MRLPLRPILSALAALAFLVLAPAAGEASIVLVYDSLSLASGGSTAELSEITSQTDSSLVSTSNSFSMVGSEVAGGFVHSSQSNTTGAFSDQNDLNFRFGSNPEVQLTDSDVSGSLASGNYIEFGYTAAQAQILDGFDYNLQANSANGTTYAARDSGLFVSVNSGAFTQFGATDQGSNGINGNVSFTDAVTVSSGDVITYRLAFADKTNISQNLQSATRIGNVRISATAVPEPTSLAVLGIGALALMTRRRR